jgi:hypothetical protein
MHWAEHPANSRDRVVRQRPNDEGVASIVDEDAVGPPSTADGSRDRDLATP